MSMAPLMEDCKHILKALAKLDITRVALSNTPLNELRRILAGKTLEPLLDIIRGGGNWPKTDSLNHLLDEFEFRPETCLFVGDGKGDLWAARAAGVPFVAIDPDTGEFDGDHDLNGPFANLAEWAGQAGLI